MAGLRKHDPVPEADMYKRSPRYTLCECLRDIYHEAYKIGSESIQLNARIATAMAKAMDARLKVHDRNYCDSIYDKNDKVSKPQRP